MGRSNQIRHIVRLTQMIKRWRKKASTSTSSLRISATKCVPSDVPPGHVAVCVGTGCTRFIMRASHLNHPAFKNLLRKAEEECAFDNNDGPLFIPCDEFTFEETLRVVTRSDELPTRCRVTESLPLLYGTIPEKPLC